MRIVRQSEQELVVQDGSLIVSTLSCIGSLIVYFSRLGPDPWGIVHFIAIVVFIYSLRIHSKTTVFDRGAGTVRWKSRRIFKFTSGSMPFSEVKGIGMARIPGDRSSAPYLLAVLTSQDPIPLSFSDYTNRNRCREIRGIIQVFLNIDPASALGFEPDLPDDAPIRALLSEGRKIEAIKLVRATTHVGLREAKDRVDALASKMDATL